MTHHFDIREIPLGPNMTKYHFQQPGIPAMHHMRAPDHGDPHDHPFGFPSFILFGGYREEVFELDGSSTIVTHRKGESFYVPARRIHRIVELLEDECWTITLPGEFEQAWGSWQFRDDGAYKKTWGSEEWVLQTIPPKDATMVSDLQRAVLLEVDGHPNKETVLDIRHIAHWSGLTVENQKRKISEREVRLALRALSRKGLAERVPAFTDDGLVRGSGYVLTEAGRAVAAEQGSTDAKA